MKRKFIGERGTTSAPQVRKPRDVLYTLEETIEIFIRAKTAEGVRQGTITGYHDIFRYFQQWLDDDITNVNDITADLIRNYINYLRTERTPYAKDPQRKRSGKGLSVHTINIRIRCLSTMFRFLFNEGIIPNNPMKRCQAFRTNKSMPFSPLMTTGNSHNGVIRLLFYCYWTPAFESERRYH